MTFDDPNLVANAGLLLVATLVVRLDLEDLINGIVNLSGRVGGALPGRKVLTLVHAMVAGGSHIDHADVLRSGATQSVLPHRVMAPSTLGTFLRAFTFGHVRQLDSVLAEALRRAWSLGAGPGSDRVIVDLDSTICPVCGKAKHGAGYGYTKELGYHPLIATRAGTGELLHVRMRKGSANTQRGTKRFIEELVARLRRAGATGEMVMRFDSGFWSNATIATLGRLAIGYTMGVRMVKSVVRAISAIDEGDWIPIDYTLDGIAEVAECVYKGRRMIVRRTRLVGRQATLWPEWRHFAFLTDQEGTAVEVDLFHRAHATVELAIKDLKEGAGMEHVPSGSFNANAAWLVWRPWPTTSSAGAPCSARSRPKVSSLLPARCAPGSCRCLVDWSTPQEHRRCVLPSSGRGRRRSPALSNSSGPFRRSLCSHHIRGRCTADDRRTALTTR